MECTDTEVGTGEYYTNFVGALQGIYANQSAKTYYTSASSSCYYPKSSSPLDMLNMVDWVYVRFYSTNYCSMTSSGFNASIKAWSLRLSGPRLYLGAIAFTQDGIVGYEPPSNFTAIVKSVYEMGLCNIGGIMLWDGPRAIWNVDSDGDNYIEVAKEALKS